ncbi:MAG: TonB-dependent receptor [Bacteroidales bacterium]
MKIIKRISLYVTLVIITFVSIQAQDINSTVEVKRVYKGKLSEIVKSPLLTKYSDTLQSFKLKFDYSFFDKKYEDLYEFSPMQSAILPFAGDKENPTFYLNLEGAFPLTGKANIFINPHINDKLFLTFYGKHDSFWGEVPTFDDSDIKTIADRMSNIVGVNSNYSWHDGELNFDIRFKDDYRSRYASLEDPVKEHIYLDDPVYNHYSKINARVNIKSCNTNSSKSYYNFSFNYDYVKFKGDTTKETHIGTHGLIGMATKSPHKWMLGYKFNAVHYNSSLRGIIDISPQYHYTDDRWNVTAGAIFSSKFGYTENTGDFYPLVKLKYELFENNLWLGFSLDGESNAYYYDNLIEINPYLTEYKHPSYRDVLYRLKLEASGVIKDRLSYSIIGKAVNYEHYAVVSLSEIHPNELRMTTDDFSVKSFNAALTWSSKDVKANASLTLRSLSGAIYFPRTEISTSIEYNLRQRIYLEVNANFRGKTEYNISDDNYGELNSFTNLGARISYIVSPLWTAYLKAGNLLNQKISYLPKYVFPATTLSMGICLKL